MKRAGLMVGILLLVCSAVAEAQKRSDIVFEDFEGKTVCTAAGPTGRHGAT